MLRFLLRWLKRSLNRLIEWRLGGYRQLAGESAPTAPALPESTLPPRIAVVGGGLAGIGAAATLAERGLGVTLFERHRYLGGKIGAWRVPVGQTEQTVEHGFHAFFRQYYNLNGFLDRLGLRESFRSIEDYLILDSEGRPHSFGDVATIPALNIVDLGRRGFFRWRDVLPADTRNRLSAFVQFDIDHTYAALDDVSFQQFCDDASLPEALRLSFRTFARAFFSDEADLSTADVLRAFHFYYLSHDHGLMYDYPAGDYESTLLRPIAAHLDRHGVETRLGAKIEGIERGDARRFRIGAEEFDFLVLAADIPGMQSIVGASPWMEDAAPELVESLHALRTSDGYSVWRIWVDRDVRAGLPTFINMDRKRILDSVTLYHRITEEAHAWAADHGGAVLELHSYALPADLQNEDDVRRVFLEELAVHFPELENLTIHAEALQVRHDFPAFAPGQRRHRPEPRTPIEGLFMAGDWVRLPYPMTHMEAAFTSGMICANEILATRGLDQEPIYTVARRGLLPPKKIKAA